MSTPPPILIHEQKPSPPRPKFVVEGTSDGDSERYAPIHSRTTSGAVSSYVESPPITPRSLTFNAPSNPFSPHTSVINFNIESSPGATPGTYVHGQSNHYPFPESPPRSGVTSLATSVADLPRMSSSYFGSRPNTADYSNSNRPTSTTRLRESFASPKTRPLTMYSSALSIAKVQRERPKSTMLSAQPPLQKPWIETRDPYSRIAYFLTYAVMLLGVAAGAVRCYLGWNDVALLKGNMCLVMDESFDSPDGVFGENGKFFREVDMSGFGNGEFEMTTGNENNSYVRDGHLYITPTLTSDNIGLDAITDGHVYNITGCTFNITQGGTYTQSSKSTGSSHSSSIVSDNDFDLEGYVRACSAVSNATSGQIINPIQSARLSTRRSASIRYGRVEVRAKLPTGDWLWPAIWMLPVDSAYGAWPLSGEIDIMEARGNGPHYPIQGTNWVRGSLNWGPLLFLNGVSKTFGAWQRRRGSYAQDFHTYILEWSPDFIRMSVDTRLHHMLDMRIKKSFWDLGEFPSSISNGSDAIILNNPWTNGTKAAPFDQPFYLILDVGVGGTNGWFPDGSGKPWIDQSAVAMGDFWRSRDKWLPTWPEKVEDRSLVVDSVKMWQLC